MMNKLKKPLVVIILLGIVYAAAMIFGGPQSEGLPATAGGTTGGTPVVTDPATGGVQTPVGNRGIPGIATEVQSPWPVDPATGEYIDNRPFCEDTGQVQPCQWRVEPFLALGDLHGPPAKGAPTLRLSELFVYAAIAIVLVCACIAGLREFAKLTGRR